MAEIDLSAEVRGFEGPAIDVSAIERDLNGLWRMPTLTGLRQEDVVPARTSVLNLVVYAANKELARRSAQIIGQLATHHPSRAIIFAVANDESAFKTNIDAHVSTHCFAAAGERFAACFEEIQITVPRDSLDYLSSIILPLALPDLPTFIWWPGQPPFGDRRFLRVLEAADRLILDSLDFPRCTVNLARAEALLRQVGDCPSVVDLNWRRLIPWRRSLARFFDLEEYRWAIDHLVHLRLEYGHTDGQRDNEGQALLVLGWLAGRLGWRIDDSAASDDGWRFIAQDPRGQRITIDLSARAVPRRFNGFLLELKLAAKDGGHDADFVLSRVGDDLTTIRAGASCSDSTSFEHAMQAAPLDVSKLLSRELEITARESLYEEALAEASRYAALMKNRSQG